METQVNIVYYSDPLVVYSQVLTRVVPIFPPVHFYLFVFYSFLLVFYSCSTRVLLVFTCVYWCSPVLCSCSLVFILVWCFRLDHLESTVGLIQIVPSAWDHN